MTDYLNSQYKHKWMRPDVNVKSTYEVVSKRQNMHLIKKHLCNST